MIEIKNLNKRYDDKIVFKDFSCSFKENVSNTIMGKSGCGKTTLLRILCGLEKCDSGEITGMPNDVSIVFQDDTLISSITPYKNINYTIDKQVTKESIKNHLKELGLGDYINKPTSELSGGMKRRVAIIRAMLSPSSVVIMDEPFKGLDDNTKSEVIEYIKKYLNGRTFILVTHDEQDVKSFDSTLITIE